MLNPIRLNGPGSFPSNYGGNQEGPMIFFFGSAAYKAQLK